MRNEPMDIALQLLKESQGVIEKKKKLMECTRCNGTGMEIVGYEQQWQRTREKPQGEMVPYAITGPCTHCKGDGMRTMGWVDRTKAKMQQMRESRKAKILSDQMAQLGESRTGESRPPGLGPKLCWNCRGSGMIVDEEGNRTTCPHCKPSQDE